MKNLFMIIMLTFLYNSISQRALVFHNETTFYDFQNSSYMDFSSYAQYKNEYIVDSIFDPRVESLYFNFGINHPSKYCNQETIACIKFAQDPQYYSLSSSKNWKVNESDNNVIFNYHPYLTQFYSLEFTPRGSSKVIGPNQQFGKITFSFYCDISSNLDTYLYVYPNTYSFVLKIYDQNACLLPINPQSRLFHIFSSFLGIFSIFLGFFITIYSIKFIREYIFFSGMIIGFIGTLMIASLFLSRMNFLTYIQEIGIVIGSLFAGLFFGLFMIHFKKLGDFMNCALSGIVFFIVLFSLFISNMAPIEFLYGGSALSGFIFGVIGTTWSSYFVLLIPPSIIGAYLIFRGLSVFVYGFPSEFLIIPIKNSGETLNIFPYYYVVGIFIVIVIGVILKRNQFFKILIDFLIEERKREEERRRNNRYQEASRPYFIFYIRER